MTPSTTTDLKNEIEKSLGLLRTLRDEVRLKIHLAGMDARDEWNTLEPQLVEIERKAIELSEATRSTIGDAVKRLTKLSASLV
jgi:hypothetical protein